MQITGNLTPKQRQRIAKKATKKQRRDFVQPYINNKPNPEFERIYGKGSIKRYIKQLKNPEMGAGQNQFIKEYQERLNHDKTN